MRSHLAPGAKPRLGELDFGGRSHPRGSTHERGRARDVANDLRGVPFIEYHANRGFKIENKHIDVLARELRDECDFNEFRIEATLSHFGGFE